MMGEHRSVEWEDTRNKQMRVASPLVEDQRGKY